MVNRVCSSGRSCRAALIMELVVAMAILVLAILPVSYGFWHEATLARAYYHRALAMEIVDGEMEILAAGEWRAYQEGTQVYPVTMASATNLPPGQFVLTVQAPLLRLAWQPRGRGSGSPVVRETTIHENK